MPTGAMAAAVLVLHQGVHLVATLQRGAERVIGTLVGLGFAALILVLHPQGWWLIAVVAGLQFASRSHRGQLRAGHDVHHRDRADHLIGDTPVDIAALILDRGLDTVLGCGIGCWST